MNTSEVLDLSKENIQPLKQGRNAVKLGTALQAQTNVELHQKLLAEREQFEMLIRMYEGDDPIKPHYDYVHWIEQSFPKHGPESNLVQILENTLATFKDDQRYKQDLRYADLLIKYIDMQSNPVEIYQLVYDQGLCTMCAPFYVAWANELDKNNDIKNADQIYELGLRVKAQPIELLQEAHLRFQLSVGRRMLGRQTESTEGEADFNRQALHKLQKRNVHSVREPVGAPGRVRQQTLGNHNSQNAAPFKVYQGDDQGKDYNNCGDSQGKMFPKENLVNRENQLKPGPWSQSGGKHRSRAPEHGHTPTFQVHEDEGADIRNGHHKISSVPRALKPRKIDNFTCPLAVFEPPDPTKRPMYCKNKVYAGGREFQLEELRALIYNRRYEQLAALKIKQEVKKEMMFAKEQDDIESVETMDIPVDEQKFEIQEVKAGSPVETVSREPLYKHHLQGPNTSSQAEVKSASTSEISQEDKQSTFHAENNEEVFKGKILPLEANNSMFHCQSFTVNTKEAMNVVQEMWNSPSPSPAFSRNARASQACVSSPVGLDESGVFKVPLLPPPLTKTDSAATPKLAGKSTSSFPIYCDDGPAPSPSQHFQIYTDESEDAHSKQDSKEVDSESWHIKNTVQKECIRPMQPFNPSHNNGVRPPIQDAATLKMLAFQSDSDDSSEDLPKESRNTVAHGKVPEVPLPVNGPPTPLVETKSNSHRKSFGGAAHLHPVFHDEDGSEDMTCNTKAFDFVLPSSTPLVGHLKNPNGQSEKQCANGSYITEEVKKCGTKRDLSLIFEASGEKYSSSSGSSSSKTQGSVCTAANTSAQPEQADLMARLAQISSNKSVEELEKSIGLLDISGPVDPFSTELITQLLTHIGYPRKHHLIGFHKFDTDAPPLQSNSIAKLGPTKYSVIGELGKGNYARVLKASKDGRPVALKQQRPAWEWEWYIVQELQSRLPPNMMGGYLLMGTGYIYKNASILESDWAQFGTFLSVVNKMKIAGKNPDLHLSVLFSIQLISIIEHLHKCEIIHGDIKPDNFVLCSVPSAVFKEPCLKLIDFGRSIDMTLFPKGTTFSTVVTTDGFQCNEMKDGRQWTYQTDLYGLAGCIYCVLFYDYMKVIKKGQKWQLSNKIPRYMAPDLWQDIFTSLLNVESCEDLQDLAVLREKLELRFNNIESSAINQSIQKLSNVLLNK